MTGLKTRITKKDFRSACDLRDTGDFNPYMVTEATDTQRQIPDFLTERVHSNSNLEREKSTHNVFLDTATPAPEPEVSETPKDPINRLADVLANLQKKPQSKTNRPVTTNTMTFDGRSKKFELFEDLSHTMIKMQPAITEQMKINHFQSFCKKELPQTFRNIKSPNRQTLEDVLVKFRRNYVKTESEATVKHKWQKLF